MDRGRRGWIQPDPSQGRRWGAGAERIGAAEGGGRKRRGWVVGGEEGGGGGRDGWVGGGLNG